jgi:hypothetical protein
MCSHLRRRRWCARDSRASVPRRPPPLLLGVDEAGGGAGAEAEAVVGLLVMGGGVGVEGGRVGIEREV